MRTWELEVVIELSILSNLWSKIKSFILPPAAVEHVFGVPPVITREMEDSINLWYAMYTNKQIQEGLKPLGIAASICRQIARPALIEFKADITGSQRADYLQEQFEAAKEHFLTDLETGLALGGVTFKPYIFGKKILVDSCGPLSFQPTHFDISGRCIGGVFKSTPIMADRQYYVRMEYHDLQGTDYTILNKAFKSDQSGTIGAEVNLSIASEWEDIPPEIHIQNLEGPLFSYYKNPVSNNIDSGSNIGVSIYSGPAIDLIMQAEKQWSLLMWEYKSGKRKIYADDPQGGGPSTKEFDRDLFELGMFSGDGNFFKEWSPVFRDNELYRGFQFILKRVESAIGTSFGLISDPAEVERTATEVIHSRQNLYVIVDSIQKALKHTFDGLLYAMDVYCDLYPELGVPDGDYKVTYDFGDSVLDDEETKAARNADMRLDVSSQLLRPEIYLSKKYGVTEEEARAMMPSMGNMEKEEKTNARNYSFP